jgi:hypothetical protein
MGTYDASDEKFIERLNQEHKSRAVKLDILNELKLTSDYLTQQEMEKFKKPKKVRKVLRKNKLLKAEDLLPTINVNNSENKISDESMSNSSFKVKKESTQAQNPVDSFKKTKR